MYGRGRQIRGCGVEGGGRGRSSIDIGPIKSDRPPPSSEAPPVSEIVQPLARLSALARGYGGLTIRRRGVQHGYRYGSRLTDERTRWRLTTSTNHYTISNRRSWLDEPGGSPSTATATRSNGSTRPAHDEARAPPRATGAGGCARNVACPTPRLGGDSSEKERAHHMRDSFTLVNQLGPVAAGGGWPAICAQTAMRLATRETCSRERRRGATSS